MSVRRPRVRALQAFGSDLDRAIRLHERSTDPARGRPGRVAVAALAGVLLAGVLAVTPPGRALAERLAELAGIGEEPTSSLDSPVDLPDTVFGVGETPNGTGYEVVASADQNLARDAAGETCVTVEFPGIEPRPRWFSCNTNSLSRSNVEDPLHLVARVGPAALGEHRMMVSGLVGPQISSVVIEHRGSDGRLTTYDADVLLLGGGVRKAIGSTEDLRFALAFLPTDLVPPKPDGLFESVDVDRDPAPVDPSENPVNEALRSFTVVGFDASGREVARQVLGEYIWAFMGLYPPPAPSSRAEAYDDAFEACLRELADAQGAPVKPDLSESELSALNACARQRRE